MAKLPFGGFDATGTYDEDPPWLRLATIAEYLEEGEALPPPLAQWFCNAIRRCHQDPQKFLVELGLKRARGKPPADKNDWLTWGGLVDRLESERGPEQAITEALEIAAEKGIDFSRSKMQDMRNKYRSADYTED